MRELAIPVAAPAPSWLAPAGAALLLFGAWAVLPRAIGAELSGVEQQIVSSFGLLPLLFVLGRGLSLRGRAGRGSALAFGAGVLTNLGNVAYYVALSDGGATSVLAPLTALYPLVTVLLSVAFLHERLAGVQAAGVALGLVAIYLFAADGTTMTGARHLLWPLASVVLWGVSAVGQKVSIAYVSPRQSSFFYLGATLPVSAVLWAWMRPSSAAAFGTRTLLLAAALGALLGLGNVCLAVAYGRAGKASVVTTMAALYWVLAVPVGVVVFAEPIGARKIVALAVAVAATIALCSDRAGARENA